MSHSDDDSDRLAQDRYGVEMSYSEEETINIIKSVKESVKESGKESGSRSVTVLAGAYEDESDSETDCSDSSYETDSEDDETSAYESERDLGAVVSYATEDIEDIMTVDSMPAFNWFDTACGWLDRPLACTLTNGGRKASLLHESKSRATSALRSVKINDSLSKATRKAISAEDKRSVRLERKGLMETEKIKESKETTDNMETEKIKESETTAEKKNKAKSKDNADDKPQEEPEEQADKDVMEVAYPPVTLKPREKELRVVKKKRIAAYKSRLRDRQSEESVHSGASTASSKKRRQPPRPKHPRPHRLGDRQDEEGINEVAATLDSSQETTGPPIFKFVSSIEKKDHQGLNKEYQDKEKSTESAPSSKTVKTVANKRGKSVDRKKEGKKPQPTNREHLNIDELKLPESEDIRSLTMNASSTEWQVSSHGPEENLSMRSERASVRKEKSSSSGKQRSKSQGPTEKNSLRSDRDSLRKEWHSARGKQRSKSQGPEGKNSSRSERASMQKKRAKAELSLYESEASVTDLTHIGDPALETLPSEPSFNSKQKKSPPKLAIRDSKKSKKKKPEQVEVIDVLELDDEDSWTPGEQRDPSPSESTHTASKNPFEPSRDPSPSKSVHSSRIARDPSPTKSKHTSRLETPTTPKKPIMIDDDIERRVTNIWEEEEEKLKKLAVKREATHRPKAQEPTISSRRKSSKPWMGDEGKLQMHPRKDIFDDPKAREEFAGQRKGRLEENDKTPERRSRSKSLTRRQRLAESPRPESVYVSDHSERSKRSKSLDVRGMRGSPDADGMIQQSRSRDSRNAEVQASKSREIISASMKLERRQRAMESRSPHRQQTAQHEDAWETESRRSKARDLVGVRSIEEGQRLRGLKDMPEIRITRSREARDVGTVPYGIPPNRSRETPQPIDVDRYIADSRSRKEQDRSRVSMSREMTDSRSDLLDARGIRSSKSREGRDDHLLRSSRSGEQHEVYSQSNGLVIRKSTSRDTHGGRSIHSRSAGARDITDVSDIPDGFELRKTMSRGTTRGPRNTVGGSQTNNGRGEDDRQYDSTDYGARSKSRDIREDHDTRHSRSAKLRSQKEDPAGHSNSDEFEERSRAGSRRSSKGSSRTTKETVISAAKELRRLEKKIEKQLKHVTDGHQSNADWDERSVSSMDLRTLEKQLVLKLRREDEKRASKLKRIRRKKDSHRFSSTEDRAPSQDKHRFSSTEDRTSVQDKVKSEVKPKSISEKVDDLREKTKYGQLKVLRSSKQMSKYMSTSNRRGLSPAPRRGLSPAPRPEEY
jgi:hypothetical protein